MFVSAFQVRWGHWTRMPERVSGECFSSTGRLAGAQASLGLPLLDCGPEWQSRNVWTLQTSNVSVAKYSSGSCGIGSSAVCGGARAKEAVSHG